MAVFAPRTRSWSAGRVPKPLLLLGLAAALAAGGTYVAIAGNPLAQNQQAVTYQTAAVSQGALQVTISAAGPITMPNQVPLSFKNSGKLSEVDVSLGQQVGTGQVLAKVDATDLQAAVDQAQASLNQQRAAAAKVAAGATPRAGGSLAGPDRRGTLHSGWGSEEPASRPGQRWHHGRQRAVGHRNSAGQPDLQSEVTARHA